MRLNLSQKVSEKSYIAECFKILGRTSADLGYRVGAHGLQVFWMEMSIRYVAMVPSSKSVMNYPKI